MEQWLTAGHAGAAAAAVRPARQPEVSGLGGWIGRPGRSGWENVRQMVGGAAVTQAGGTWKSGGLLLRHLGLCRFHQAHNTMKA